MRSIIQSKVWLLLVIFGVAVAIGSCSPDAQDDTPAPATSGATKTEETGEPVHHTLREEVATLFSRFDQAYDITRLGEDMAVEIKGAKIRGIDSYEYPILKFGSPAFDLEQLRNGQLPYYVQGDFDCDGKEDRGALLSAPKTMVAISLGKGATLAFPDYDGDVIQKGSKGSHRTAAGKGYGTPKPGDPKRFESHCEFVSVHWWERSSYAIVYDPTSGAFQQIWLSD